MAQALIAAVYTALAKSPQWKNCCSSSRTTSTAASSITCRRRRRPTTRSTKFGVDWLRAAGLPRAGDRHRPVRQAGLRQLGRQYDHTSALKHLQNAFDLEPLNVAHGRGERPHRLHRHGPAREGRLGAAGRDPRDRHRRLGSQRGGLHVEQPVHRGRPDHRVGEQQPGQLPDARADMAEYHQAIRDFLAKNQGRF